MKIISWLAIGASSLLAFACKTAQERQREKEEEKKCDQGELGPVVTLVPEAGDRAFLHSAVVGENGDIETIHFETCDQGLRHYWALLRGDRLQRVEQVIEEGGFITREKRVPVAAEPIHLQVADFAIGKWMAIQNHLKRLKGRADVIRQREQRDACFKWDDTFKLAAALIDREIVFVREEDQSKAGELWLGKVEDLRYADQSVTMLVRASDEDLCVAESSARIYLVDEEGGCFPTKASFYVPEAVLRQLSGFGTTEFLNTRRFKKDGVTKECRPIVALERPEPEPWNLTLEGTHFQSGSAELVEAGKRILDQNLDKLKKDPELMIWIEGHTDDVGGKEFNQRLSERRAQAVYHYLRDQGISPGRMRTAGFGDTKPRVSNDNEGNRALNRRVEIRITGERIKLQKT